MDLLSMWKKYTSSVTSGVEKFSSTVRRPLERPNSRHDAGATNCARSQD